MNGGSSRGRVGLSDALFGVILFALALAPRLYVAMKWTAEAVWDGHYYEFGAHRIAHGLGYSDDLNVDGTANYGMYADWLQELQVLAGPAIMNDMFNGAEAYLEMWQRAFA